MVCGSAAEHAEETRGVLALKETGAAVFPRHWPKSQSQRDRQGVLYIDMAFSSLDVRVRVDMGGERRKTLV